MPAKSVRKSALTKSRLFLVEDHPVTREGFEQLLNFQADLQVCGQAGTAARAITAIDALKPELVIVDISLADSNGLELIKQLKTTMPDLPILVLSMHDESLYAERALRAGARGYVMKQAPTTEVMAAIRCLLKGELYLSERMRSRLVHQHLQGVRRDAKSEVDYLSDRELEVFELIGRGQTTRGIAGKLHVSISTVETHRAHIKDKLKLSNSVELIRHAVEWASR
jgi:DNA-binding NarL/FixJ family response regulator